MKMNKYPNDVDIPKLDPFGEAPKRHLQGIVCQTINPNWLVNPLMANHAENLALHKKTGVRCSRVKGHQCPRMSTIDAFAFSVETVHK